MDLEGIVSIQQSSSKERSTSSESEREAVLEIEMFATRGMSEEARCT